MNATQYDKWLSTIQVPNATFTGELKEDGYWIKVTVSAEDRDSWLERLKDPNLTPVVRSFHDYVRLPALDPKIEKEEFFQYARRLLLYMIQHEVDEMFLVDGERIFDPHKKRNQPGDK